MANQPMTDEHLALLRKLDESCTQTRQYLEDCKGCFLDVDEEINLNEEQHRICLAIKAKFFPNKV